MKWTILLIAVLAFLQSGKSQTENKQSASETYDTVQLSQYSEMELSNFLDSIGKLNPDSWTEKVSFKIDSTLTNQTALNSKLNQADFDKLKECCKSGEIEVLFAKKILPHFDTDSNFTSDYTIPIVLYSFDKKKYAFTDFAIAIGYDDGLSWNNDVYFFCRDKIISKHQIFHRYGLELKFFKNENKETVIYYKVNFESGSGIWWHQFNFYTYCNEALIPALTEIQNVNLQFPWSMRAYWIESAIVSTTPLKLKFRYNNQFPDKNSYDAITILNDSTEILYRFNTKINQYSSDFTDSKLTQQKLLSYYIGDNELLFINAHYRLLKDLINGSDRAKRSATLNYLNDVKNLSRTHQHPFQ